MEKEAKKILINILKDIVSSAEMTRHNSWRIYDKITDLKKLFDNEPEEIINDLQTKTTISADLSGNSVCKGSEDYFENFIVLEDE